MLLALSLLACVTDDWTAPDYPALVPGPPVVGAAEGHLKLPVGTPLGGYTARCTCMTGFSGQDDRESAYNTTFVESAGVQTYPTIKVIWVENGDEHLVLTKTDSIYSYDGLVEALEDELEAATGLPLDGRVVHATNHSHSSFGTFSDQIGFYLGTDRYNHENFRRMVAQITDVALEAYEQREPAKIGVGITRDWDPDDRVYRDRRGENDELAVWPDAEPGMGKDPHLAIWRFDRLDDSPIAMLANFGMHGILGGEDNPMVSSDSGGGFETGVEESFDAQVVVLFTQGSGGDASPAGSDDGFARIETIGAYATAATRELYDAIATSADPIRMETVSRSLWEHPDQITVTRDGTVDWSYLPYKEWRQPDNEVYAADGSLLSPFDEFNSSFGAAFCGTGDLDLPVGKLLTTAYPYSNCLDFELLSILIQVFFQLEEDDIELPLAHSIKAGTTASLIGPLPILDHDGSSSSDDVLLGFFPGEATAMYTEQWRRRVKAELGYDHTLMVSYAQDHEGYLMIPEDWLMGGYEPDISLWGPLQGEFLMEGVLDMVGELLSTDVREDPDPLGHYQPTEYGPHELPTLQPDLTPAAGTRLDAPPEYYWVPERIAAELVMPAELPRVQGLAQVGWIGGDPGIDSPTVTVERLEGTSWVPLASHTGRVITEADHDILLGYTPDPLRPHEELQTHYWWAGWQAVGHVRERASLPLGTYRLHVEGTAYVGGDTTWPWTGESYTVDSEPFELVAAELAVTQDGFGLWVSNPGHDRGFRLVALDGAARGDNPVEGPLTVVIDTPGGPITEEIAAGATSAGRTAVDVVLPVDATAVTVTDPHGNAGTLVLP